MRNRISIYLGLILSLGTLSILVLFLLPFYMGPENLILFSWRLLYCADRLLGALIPLPPVVSWMVFGCCLGISMQLLLQDLEHPSRFNRITRWSMLGALLLWALAAQPFIGELTIRRDPIQVRQWWRPESYRSPGTPRIAAGFEFRWIPPGTFTKGSPPTEKGRMVDEVQRLIVIPRGFWIGAKEVTWKEWLRVMPPPTGHPVPPVDLELPVRGVSYEEAEAFCRALSEKETGTFRLPTESEWEYACRAGTTTAYFFGDQADDLSRYAWVKQHEESETPLGPSRASTARANPWGLMDTLGNVAEWCVADTTGDAPISYRVYRGGSWKSPPSACRAAARGIQLLDQPTPDDIGLRVVWEP